MQRVTRTRIWGEDILNLFVNVKSTIILDSFKKNGEEIL